MYILFRVIIYFSLVLLLIIGKAHAFLEFEYNFTSHWLDQDLDRRRAELGKLQRENKKRAEKLAKKNGNKRDDGNDKKNAKIIGGNFKFNYDPKLSPIARQQAIDGVIELGREVGTMNAEKENLLNKAFGDIDIMKTIGAALQKKGHSPHSLATAVGYWLVSHLQVAQDTDFTDQQLAAVVKQVERQLRKTKLPDDAEKQMAAEHLLWTATFQLLSYQDVRKTGSKQEQKTIAEVSRTMLRQQFGMDADKMTITDKGLVSQ